MAETSGPWDGTPWAQSQWYQASPAWAPSGVYGTAVNGVTTAGSLPLTVNGLTVTLGTGRGWVHGAGYSNDAAKAFTVTANTNASLSRRDRIVLRRDLSAKSVIATRLAGTAAATPVAPSLTQVETGIWDEPLFSFLVPPNSGTTLTGFVDERTFIDGDGNGRSASYGAVNGWTNTLYAGTNNYELGVVTVNPQIGPYIALASASGDFTGSSGVSASLRVMTPGGQVQKQAAIPVGTGHVNPTRAIPVPGGGALVVTANLEVLAGTVTAYADARHSLLEVTVIPSV